MDREDEHLMTTYSHCWKPWIF